MSPRRSAGKVLSARPVRARLPLSLAGRMVVATGTLALLLAAVFALLLAALLDLRQATSREARAKEVIVAALALEKLVLDLETGARGFAISGDPRLLSPWRQARRSIPVRIAALQRLLHGRRRELSRLRALAASIRSYEQDYSLPLVRIARRSPAPPAPPWQAARASAALDAIRADFARFLAEERARAATSAASAKAESARALWLGVAGLGAAGLLLVAFALYLTRAIAGPVREVARAASRVAAGDLGVRLGETGLGEVGELTAAFNAMTLSLQRSQRELETRAAQQRAVAELSKLALAETDPAALLEAAVRSVAETLAVERVALWERSPGEEVLLLRAGVGWGEHELRLGLPLSLREGGSVAGGPGAAEVPVVPELTAAGIQSGLTVAVPEAGLPLTALGAYTSDERAFDRDEELFLHAVASLLAATVSRRRLEEGLRQAQKLEALGRLAGGIAHDFNNILLAIKAEAWLLRSALSAESRELELVAEIDAAVERAGALVRQLLAFSSRQPWQEESINPSTVVAAVAEMLDPLIGEDVELSVEADPDPGFVHMDRAQLEQVVMNLVVNAREAMPQGGPVRISVRRVERPAGEGEASGSIVIEVADSGVGISREDQLRIFDPFFSTKGSSGLGLAIVHGIVARAGGRIEVASAPGAGSTFAVYLPRSAEAAAMPAPPRQARPGPGSETVLLVEDDDMVRVPLASILAEHGYRVLSAANASEALRLSKEGERPIDLLITDVVMPDLSGPELARVLQHIQPGLKVMYVSGYPERAAAFAGLEEAFAAREAVFVHKPFAPETLLGEIRMLLQGAEQAAASGRDAAHGLSPLAR
jgi:signal transduction histidine kinase/CHASE3 domain sensor protein/FixJ family two-component response regulator